MEGTRKIKRIKKRIRSLEIDLHYSQNMLEKVSDVMTYKEVDYGPDYQKHYDSMYHLWLFRVRRQEKRLRKLRTKLFKGRFR
jgi:uncharacterized C2H2 Zn-finger protein